MLETNNASEFLIFTLSEFLNHTFEFCGSYLNINDTETNIESNYTGPSENEISS